MNSEQIIKSDVLDILFENRNKMYGAYNLRKFYNNRMGKALGVMLALVAVFVAYSFMTPHEIKRGKEPYSDSLITVIATMAKKDPPVELPKPAKAPVVPQNKFLSNIKIEPDKNVKDTVTTIANNALISNINVDPVPGDPVPFVGQVPGTGDPGPVDPGPAKEPEPTINPEVPIDNPDVEPQFPGGMQRLRTFLQNNLNNPKDMEEGEKVRVVVKFVVGYDGKLKAFETVQDGGEEFNREVMRVLKRMPEWIPGKAKGQNVSVFFTLPVVFTPAE